MSDAQTLKKRMSSLSDEELVKMVTEKAADYRSDALGFAKAELRSRGVDYSSTSEDTAGETAEEPDTVDPLTPILLGQRALNLCRSCGGPLRMATLIADKEVTIVFADNREERFVLVSVCSGCGMLSLVADLETDVQGR